MSAQAGTSDEPQAEGCGGGGLADPVGDLARFIAEGVGEGSTVVTGETGDCDADVPVTKYRKLVQLLATVRSSYIRDVIAAREHAYAGVAVHMDEDAAQVEAAAHEATAPEATGGRGGRQAAATPSTTHAKVGGLPSADLRSFIDAGRPDVETLPLYAPTDLSLLTRPCTACAGVVALIDSNRRKLRAGERAAFLARELARTQDQLRAASAREDEAMRLRREAEVAREAAEERILAGGWLAAAERELRLELARAREECARLRRAAAAARGALSGAREAAARRQIECEREVVRLRRSVSEHEAAAGDSEQGEELRREAQREAAIARAAAAAAEAAREKAVRERELACMSAAEAEGTALRVAAAAAAALAMQAELRAEIAAGGARLAASQRARAAEQQRAATAEAAHKEAAALASKRAMAVSAAQKREAAAARDAQTRREAELDARRQLERALKSQEEARSVARAAEAARTAEAAARAEESAVAAQAAREAAAREAALEADIARRAALERALRARRAALCWRLAGQARARDGAAARLRGAEACAAVLRGSCRRLRRNASLRYAAQVRLVRWGAGLTCKLRAAEAELVAAVGSAAVEAVERRDERERHAAAMVALAAARDAQEAAALEAQRVALCRAAAARAAAAAAVALGAQQFLARRVRALDRARVRAEKAWVRCADAAADAGIGAREAERRAVAAYALLKAADRDCDAARVRAAAAEAAAARVAAESASQMAAAREQMAALRFERDAARGALRDASEALASAARCEQDLSSELGGARREIDALQRAVCNGYREQKAIMGAAHGRAARAAAWGRKDGATCDAASQTRPGDKALMASERESFAGTVASMAGMVQGCHVSRLLELSRRGAQRKSRRPQSAKVSSPSARRANQQPSRSATSCRKPFRKPPWEAPAELEPTAARWLLPPSDVDHPLHETLPARLY